MSKKEYLSQFVDSINQSHQITHLCVPYISSKYITNAFIDYVKTNYNINITVIPFNVLLFKDLHENNSACELFFSTSSNEPYNIKDGLYILIDSNDPHIIMKYIGIIQNHINNGLKEYKSNDTLTSWTLHYLDNKIHKWVGE